MEKRKIMRLTRERKIIKANKNNDIILETESESNFD